MKKFLAWAMVVASLAQGTPVYADSSGDMIGMLESLKQQMSKMQSTIDAQNMRIQQLESRRVLETPQPSTPIPASPAAAMSEKDWETGIKDNIGKAMPWLKGLKQSGDFRTRMENFEYYDKDNTSGSTGTAGDRTRNRFRIRLRWGLEKEIGEDWKVGFRLATGGTTDPNSTNQTLGNTGYFVYKSVVIDKAYATYSPNGLKDYGPLRGVTFGAGKFDNPFLRWSTPIVWDGDVTPEGIYEQAKISLISTEDNKLDGQLTLGQFIVNENNSLEADAGLYGYQGALTLSTYGFGTEKPINFSGAVSYYDYTNWFQTVNSNTAGVSFLRTNSIVADDFRVIDFYPEVSFSLNGTPVTLWYDYVKNLANVGTDDIVRSAGNDIHDSDEAWGIGIKVGKAKKKGEWEAFYGYYEIGANAVVAAFNDSDFGGPNTNGFTNRMGHKFGMGYQLTDSITINWTGYLVDTLEPFNNGSTNNNGNTAIGLNDAKNESVFRSQLDAVYKF